MLLNILQSQSLQTEAFTSVSNFILCVIFAIITGIIIASSYMLSKKYSKSFVLTLCTLPAIVCVVIMMVNGNLGTGVAVAGAFSLVRFRSAPGSAKEINAIFLSMCAGLMLGMGYVLYALGFSVFICIFNIIIEKKLYKKDTTKTLKITIPENLNYTEVFDDLFLKFTNKYQLTEVKTTNLGSLFKLTYEVALKDEICEKEFIDALRVRNGNLEILIAKQELLNNTL